MAEEVQQCVRDATNHQQQESAQVGTLCTLGHPWCRQSRTAEQVDSSIIQQDRLAKVGAGTTQCDNWVEELFSKSAQ